MKISAVIYCKNQKSTLGPCITSLRSQTTPFFDICIVDDGSTDGVRFEARKYTDKNLSYIYVPDIGFKDAILSGLHQVAGEVTLIASANNWFDARYLEVYSGYLGRLDFGGVIGSAFQQDPEVQGKVSVVPLENFQDSDLIFTTRWALDRSKFFLNKKASTLLDLLWSIHIESQHLIIHKEPLYFRGMNTIQQQNENKDSGNPPKSILEPEYIEAA